MKALIAISISALLLLAAGYFATTTVSELQYQECASGEAVDSYRNSWQDVYFFWQWWPNRDEGKGFIACVGPATYLRYHPYDMAVLAFVGAGVAGWIGLKDQPKDKKKS